PESMDMLRNIETNYNPWGVGWDQRGRWAEGLGVRTLAEAIAANEPVDVLYWVGCAASFDDRNRKVAQAFARILRKAGVRFAILGAEEKCTGDPARRMSRGMCCTASRAFASSRCANAVTTDSLAARVAPGCGWTSGRASGGTTAASATS